MRYEFMLVYSFATICDSCIVFATAVDYDVISLSVSLLF